MLPSAAREFDLAQRRRVVGAVALARSAWALMGEDFDRSWVTVGPKLLAVVTMAQLGAARDGAAFVPAALAQQRQKAPADARVAPAAFAGVASDGRPLLSLLYGAVVQSRGAEAGSLIERLSVGRSWLDMTVQTAVADAGRDASMAAVVARPRVQWVRIVTPPCCQRCAVLAGRVYQHSEAFKRHPGCNCSMLPQTVANPDATGITIGPEDVRDLTAKQRQAIADGADFNKVVNDYQRKRGDFLPPSRVDQLSARRSRIGAVEALTQAGYLAA